MWNYEQVDMKGNGKALHKYVFSGKIGGVEKAILHINSSPMIDLAVDDTVQSPLSYYNPAVLQARLAGNECSYSLVIRLFDNEVLAQANLYLKYRLLRHMPMFLSPAPQIPSAILAQRQYRISGQFHPVRRIDEERVGKLTKQFDIDYIQVTRLARRIDAVIQAGFFDLFSVQRCRKAGVAQEIAPTERLLSREQQLLRPTLQALVRSLPEHMVKPYRDREYYLDVMSHF